MKRIVQAGLFIVGIGLIALAYMGFLPTAQEPVIMPAKAQRQSGMVSVNQQMESEITALSVRHRTKGHLVFIECVLDGISFRESNKSTPKIGKLAIWVDGKRKSDVTSAAFIIKGLSPGTHHLKLEVMNLENKSYGLEKEFIVKIPN